MDWKDPILLQSASSRILSGLVFRRIDMVRFGIAVLLVLATAQLHGQEWDTWQVSAFGVFGIPYGERCIEIRPVNPMNQDPTIQGLCTVVSIGTGVSVRKGFLVNDWLLLHGGLDYVIRHEHWTRSVLLGLVDDEVNYLREKNLRVEIPVHLLYISEKFSVGFGVKWLAWEMQKLYKHTDRKGKYLTSSNEGRLITEDFVPSFRTAYLLDLGQHGVSIFTEVDYRSQPVFRKKKSGWIDLLAGVSYHF